MEFSKLKLSYIISATDTRKPSISVADYLLVLTDDFKIPSVYIEDIESDNAHLNYLRELNNSYIKYDFDYVKPLLGGFRIKDGTPEVTYITRVNYIPGLNSSGRLISLAEKFDGNFEIEDEDYYGEIFIKFGGKIIS